MRESVNDEWLRMIMGILIIGLFFFTLLTIADNQEQKEYTIRVAMTQEELPTENRPPEFVYIEVITARPIENLVIGNE